MAKKEVLQVESRPARYDGEPSPRSDFEDEFLGRFYEIARAVLFIGIAFVYEVVGKEPQLLDARFGGSNVHATIDLHGIGAYHLGVRK